MTRLVITLVNTLKKKIPIIFFPGKFASTYLLYGVLGNGFRIGEVSTSIFYAKQPEGDSLEGSDFGVRIMNMKQQIEYAGLRGNENDDIVNILNKLFGSGSFVNGIHPVRVALQNNDSTINGISVIANENVINCLKNEKIKEIIAPGYTGDEGINISVYGALSGFACLAMEQVFNVRKQIADRCGFEIKDLKAWLMNVNPQNNQNMLLEEMLFNTYGKKTIHTSGVYEDRRLVEDIPFGLVPVESVALDLGIDTSALTMVINKGNEVWNRGQKMKNLRTEPNHFREIGYKVGDLNVEFDKRVRIKPIKPTN